MKKLRLDLDALVVESFHPSTAEDGEGTVHAEQIGLTGWRSCLRTCPTCQLSCGPTCGDLTCGSFCRDTCQLTCNPLTGCFEQTCGGPTCQPTCPNTCLPSCRTCARTCVQQLCGPVSVFAVCP